VLGVGHGGVCPAVVGIAVVPHLPFNAPLFSLLTPTNDYNDNDNNDSVVERHDVDEAMRLMSEATLKAATDPETGA
jgi:hypothetical protein